MKRGTRVERKVSPRQLTINRPGFFFLGEVTVLPASRKRESAGRTNENHTGGVDNACRRHPHLSPAPSLREDGVTGGVQDELRLNPELQGARLRVQQGKRVSNPHFRLRGEGKNASVCQRRKTRVKEIVVNPRCRRGGNFEGGNSRISGRHDRHLKNSGPLLRVR